MARFDIHRIAGFDGYALEVQADLLASFATIVVIPLIPLEKASKPVSRLNPVFRIGGQRYVMQTQAIAAVPRKELGARAGSLTEHHFEIVAALDMLLSGF